MWPLNPFYTLAFACPVSGLRAEYVIPNPSIPLPLSKQIRETHLIAKKILRPDRNREYTEPIISAAQDAKGEDYKVLEALHLCLL